MIRQRLLVLAVLLLAAVPAVAEQDLMTQVSLFVGHPTEDAGASKGVLVVPGTAIAMPQAEPLRKAQIDDEAKQSARLAQLAADLERTLRLADVELRYRQPLTLAVNARTDLWSPSEGSDIRMTIELLGFNDESALYEVKILQGSKTLADTRINAGRGQRAVVGGLDGEEAPYLFLVVEPVSKDEATVASSDVVPPKPIHTTPPAYPETAREARIQGTVVINGIMGTDGVFRNAKVVKSLPMGLDEAALASVDAWRFQPATRGGEPIEVIYNLTVNFRLDEKEDAVKTPPKVVEQFDPQYSEQALKARVQGVVIVQVDVDAEGNVTGTEVLKPLPMGLNEKALEAVRRWRFEPATLNGEPVPGKVNVPVHFRLSS